MKVIIAGGREIKNYFYVSKAMESVLEAKGWEITEVVSGMARGVDTFGVRWAYENKIDVKKFPVLSSDWEKHGKIAGFLRNGDMAKYADSCVIIWDGKSRGSKNMLEQAKRQDLQLVVFLIEELDKILADDKDFIESSNKDKRKIKQYEMQDESVEQHRKDLRNNPTIAKMLKRLDNLEEEVGHLKTYTKSKKSKNYGK